MASDTGTHAEVLYHYCLVRRDLPIGLQIAQVVHAAGESSDRVPSGTHSVVLSVANEEELVEIANKLEGLGIPHVPIHEPADPHCGAMVAIGVEPVRDRSTLRRVLSHLPLAGKIM